MCSKCDEHCPSCCRKAISVTEDTNNAHFSCPLNFTRISQQSSVSTMSDSTAPKFVYQRRKLREDAAAITSAICEGTAPKSLYQRRKLQEKSVAITSAISGGIARNFVYQRRKLRRKSVAITNAQDPSITKRTDDCLSVVSSDSLSVAMKEHVVSQNENETEAVETPLMPPIISIVEPHLLRSDSVQGEHVFDEASKSSKHKMVEVDSIHDSCSSSKSNMELVSASMNPGVDDTGECSSSSVRALELIGKDLSEKDLCISILRSEGLLERLWPNQICASSKSMDSSSVSRTCKICGLSETTLQLLICDNCEEAFHLSCLNPRLKKLPIDEWSCHSCLKMKHKNLDTTIRKSPNIINEMGRCRNASSEGEPSLIELMLRDTEPHVTGVRVGKGFQADVPDWSGPINIDVDTFGEPLRLDPSECLSLHELNSSKPSKVSSIGNWLQCRQVIEGIGEGIDGTICGKWRRAPLFEVQNDNWECFCSIHWDLAHADCAAPQELETDQVLKQLKYIELLRPRLHAKRRKMDFTKSGGSQDSAEVVTNT